MASITRFPSSKLSLTVNVDKSAVARPWKRNFLGYSLTWHKAPRLRIAQTNFKRLEDNIRKILKEGEGAQPEDDHCRTQPDSSWLDGSGTNCAAFCGDSENVRIRAQELDEGRIEGGAPFSQSVFNQRGSWWNSGASHMNQAFP
jgi:RNA-directed DNA polymerase